MKNHVIKNMIAIAFALLAVLLVLTCGAHAQTGTILYNFTGASDGGYPETRLLFDAKGNLYGTTTSGGAHGQGTVFELSPGSGGAWTESVIYGFQGGADGSLPAAGLIRDGAGNLYGTLYNGGNLGHGAVFELSPAYGGGWTKKLLYSFSGGNDGGEPVGALVFDKKGNLYGTTPLDGLYGQGVVYELSRSAGGSWTETVLHAFVSQTTSDGQGPSGSLVFDQAENLYGLTVQGGTSNLGTVFELSPSSGGWNESIVHSFLGGNDGATPARSDLIVGPGGILYGTTTSGGSAGWGTIFRLVHTKLGPWVEKVIYTFPGGANGGNPYAGLVRDAAGNLYGTTASGVHGAGGVVFKLTRGSSDQWTESVLYTFDNPGNGSYADLIRDASGNLYGTTEFGGPAFAGNVFEVKP